MDDREMVAAIRNGDRLGLATLYDAYAAQLYGFNWSLLRDRDAAADVLQDTFVIVNARLHQLRDPDKLKPWLFAIARHECLRVLKNRTRTMPLEEAGDLADESVDLVARAHEQELRKLVWDAANGLNTGEREVLELNVRHGLEGQDLALALGVSVNHAHARLSRAREQMDRSLTALILARTGTRDCDVLASMLGDWDGQLTPLMRKRISRHVDQCDTCGERKRRDVRASALLTMLPLAVLPVELARKVSDTIEEPQLVSYRQRIAVAAGPFDWAGFPTDAERGRRRWLVPLVACLAALLLIGGTTTIVLIRNADAARHVISLPLTTTTRTATKTSETTTTTTTSATTMTTTTTTATTTTTRTTTVGRTTTRPAPPPPPVTTTTTKAAPPPPPPATLVVSPSPVVLNVNGNATAQLCVTNGPLNWNTTVLNDPRGALTITPPSAVTPASGTAGCVSLAFNLNLDINNSCTVSITVDFTSAAGTQAVPVSRNCG